MERKIVVMNRNLQMALGFITAAKDLIESDRSADEELNCAKYWLIREQEIEREREESRTKKEKA
jgi:hypothetical protein